MNADLQLLFDAMERTNARLVVGRRTLQVRLVDGKYRFLVLEGVREKYIGYDLAQALLILEGDE